MIKWFLFLQLLMLNTYAQELKLDEVLKSTATHHPVILMSLMQLEQASGKIAQQESLFDTSLNISSKNRTQGYYSGDTWDINITKPLQVLNAKIYSGMRQSTGTLPVYEGDSATQDQGEVRLGVELSLWGQRDIDYKRVKLWNEQLNLKVQKQVLKQAEIQIKTEAQKAYWKWIATGQTLKIYEQLLEVANKRNSALEKRVQKGDLAKIYLTENRQYILKRKSLLTKSFQKFQHASLYLSFFYRDNEGRVKTPKREQLLDKLDLPKVFSYEKLQKDIEKAYTDSPYLKQISLKMKQQDNELNLSETLSSPTLDLKIEQSRDYGQGAVELDQDEQKLMLQLNIPLERNLAKGSERKAQAKLKSLKIKNDFAKDQLKFSLTNLYQGMLNEYQLIVNGQDEVQAAIALEQAENNKFTRGASDFFLVNIREQNTADAQINLVDSRLNYLINLLDYEQSMAGILPAKY